MELEMIRVHARVYQPRFFIVDFILLHFSDTKREIEFYLKLLKGKEGQQLAQNCHFQAEILQICNNTMHL